MNKLQQETENDDNYYNSILLLSTKKLMNILLKEHISVEYKRVLQSLKHNRRSWCKALRNAFSR